MHLGALSKLRVVEYGAQYAGSYCSRLLADAGADVVKIETYDGDHARFRGPFPDHMENTDWSGLHLYLNANKRSVFLDLLEKNDISLFKKLLKAFF